MSAVIYETRSLRVLGVCDGPDSKGNCPRTLPGGQIFCGGHDLVLTKDDGAAYCDGFARGRFTVSPLSICPLIGRGHSDAREYFNPYACRASDNV